MSDDKKILINGVKYKWHINYDNNYEPIGFFAISTDKKIRFDYVHNRGDKKCRLSVCDNNSVITYSCPCVLVSSYNIKRKVESLLNMYFSKDKLLQEYHENTFEVEQNILETNKSYILSCFPHFIIVMLSFFITLGLLCNIIEVNNYLFYIFIGYFLFVTFSLHILRGMLGKHMKGILNIKETNTFVKQLMPVTVLVLIQPLPDVNFFQ